MVIEMSLGFSPSLAHSQLPAAWRKRLDAIALIQWSAFPKSACGDAAPLRTVLERESAIKRSGAERQARGFDQLKTVP